jgi:hypothetical protein
MAKSSQIRGMLLEEALLYLLRASGYQIVDRVEQGDKTLLRSGAGIQVRGRGCNHQIDAIADFTITQPFTYPQRLLVEAKSLSDQVGIEVVRNALGVFRDVQEYWIPTNQSVPSKKRFHYQYAIASTSGYSSEAEKFAYAHDIYLIPLARAGYFQPIKNSIMAFSDGETYQDPQRVGDFRRFRLAVRQNLIRQNLQLFQNLRLTQDAVQLTENFVESCHGVNRGIIALLDRRFPVFLIPNPNVRINELNRTQIDVRIFWDEAGWYINSARDNRELFTFDMPEEMLKLYLQGGILTKRRALDLKAEVLREIQFILIVDEQLRVVTLRLDMAWIEQLKETIL